MAARRKSETIIIAPLAEPTHDEQPANGTETQVAAATPPAEQVQTAPTGLINRTSTITDRMVLQPTAMPTNGSRVPLNGNHNSKKPRRFINWQETVNYAIENGLDYEVTVIRVAPPLPLPQIRLMPPENIIKICQSYGAGMYSVNIDDCTTSNAFRIKGAGGNGTIQVKMDEFGPPVDIANTSPGVGGWASELTKKESAQPTENQKAIQEARELKLLEKERNELEDLRADRTRRQRKAEEDEKAQKEQPNQAVITALKEQNEQYVKIIQGLSGQKSSGFDMAGISALVTALGTALAPVLSKIVETKKPDDSYINKVIEMNNKAMEIAASSKNQELSMMKQIVYDVLLKKADNDPIEQYLKISAALGDRGSSSGKTAWDFVDRICEALEQGIGPIVEHMLQRTGKKDVTQITQAEIEDAARDLKAAHQNRKQHSPQPFAPPIDLDDIQVDVTPKPPVAQAPVPQAVAQLNPQKPPDAPPPAAAVVQNQPKPPSDAGSAAAIPPPQSWAQGQMLEDLKGEINDSIQQMITDVKAGKAEHAWPIEAAHRWNRDFLKHLAGAVGKMARIREVKILAEPALVTELELALNAESEKGNKGVYSYMLAAYDMMIAEYEALEAAEKQTPAPAV